MEAGTSSSLHSSPQWYLLHRAPAPVSGAGEQHRHSMRLRPPHVPSLRPAMRAGAIRPAELMRPPCACSKVAVEISRQGELGQRDCRV